MCCCLLLKLERLAGVDEPPANGEGNGNGQDQGDRRRGFLQEAQALLLGFFASLLPGKCDPSLYARKTKCCTQGFFLFENCMIIPILTTKRRGLKGIAEDGWKESSKCSHQSLLCPLLQSSTSFRVFLSNYIYNEDICLIFEFGCRL